MIRIIAGGKKNANWALEAISEYEKRLHKPFDLHWEFMPEDKLAHFLEKWTFTGRDFVIVCDERGKNISSREYSEKLTNAFLANRQVTILIGGAYGFAPAVRENADFVWSFSNLVFPHALARLIVAEQTYRAAEIAANHPYHHE